MPVLTETPPAASLAELLALHELSKRGARIQVAEQYHLQPLHAARLTFIHSGKLGTVTQAQVSIAHSYHGMSLLRKALGITFEPVKITAHSFTAPLIVGPDRSGLPQQERTILSEQQIAYLDFGDKLGIFDFSDAQYRSWIRSPRLLVRGERGEINNDRVRYLVDYRTPVTLSFDRQDAGENGNLEGYYHKGILIGSEWIYKNPFIPARLSDDEIAVASCMIGMDAYVDGGPDMYSLAEASQDHYLGMMIEQAISSAQVVTTTRQPWASE